MTPEPSDGAFLRLETPSYAPAETTPEVTDEFRGLRIAAPKRVTAGPSLRIPVSAAARFADEPVPSPLWDSVTAIVVEVERNLCWVGSLMDPNRVPQPRPGDDDGAEPGGAGGGADAGEPDPDAPVLGPDPDADVPEVDPGGVATEAAHFDLRELLDLPATPGRYEISLTWGPWISNSAHVAVVPPEE